MINETFKEFRLSVSPLHTGKQNESLEDIFSVRAESRYSSYLLAHVSEE